MALFTLDVEKVLQGEFWTNRYILSTPDLGTAALVSATVLAYERAITSDTVTFTRYRVADLDPATDVFTIVPANVLGLRPTVGTLLPLFNVVRVDFQVEAGRPSRKYLRGVLTEADVAFNTIDANVVTFVNDNYATPLAAEGFYVDVDGQTINSGATVSTVAMRQLRRGSRRRTEPIL